MFLRPMSLGFCIGACLGLLACAGKAPDDLGAAPDRGDPVYSADTTSTGGGYDTTYAPADTVYGGGDFIGDTTTVQW